MGSYAGQRLPELLTIAEGNAVGGDLRRNVQSGYGLNESKRPVSRPGPRAEFGFHLRVDR